ncbi:hypothetical protein FGO68_gene15350 [Halteria grandinella]|uniref:AP2/ERF domain-containing protein n=1 Tax=Halteria grandinella TaxID=5974 RepID=A0A8J8NMA2_HALGN|nr:hypothetical protein FGO68_gene15350 [Halteria grandinella]
MQRSNLDHCGKAINKDGVSNNPKSEIILDAKKREVLSLLEGQSEHQNLIIKSKSKVHTIKGHRSSQYRGVSRNGKKWQVQVLGCLRKRYIGSILTEIEAAKIYDCFSIVSHGLKAKTNFSYKKSDIKIIIENFSPEFITSPHKSISLLRKLGSDAQQLK